MDELSKKNDAEMTPLWIALGYRHGNMEAMEEIARRKKSTYPFGRKIFPVYMERGYVDAPGSIAEGVAISIEELVVLSDSPSKMLPYCDLSEKSKKRKIDGEGPQDIAQRVMGEYYSNGGVSGFFEILKSRLRIESKKGADRADESLPKRIMRDYFSKNVGETVGFKGNFIDFLQLLGFFANRFQKERSPILGEEIEELVEDLQKNKAVLDDESEFQKRWDAKIGSDEVLINGGLSAIVVRSVSDWIRQKGLDGIADEVAKSKDTQKAREYLSALKKNNLPGYSHQKSLKKRMKERGEGQMEEIRWQYNEAKGRVFEEKKIIKKAVMILSPYQALSDFARNTINKSIKKLDWGRTEPGYRILYLSGRPHPKLDANPGESSGDCTNGAPLPFYRSDMHNIKVIYGKGHKGNIYLLQTALKEDPSRKVWHIEAIQVPMNANWEIGFMILTEILAESAVRKGVDMITINVNPYARSNYSYIRRGIDNCIGKKDYRIDHISFPALETYKTFAAARKFSDGIALAGIKEEQIAYSFQGEGSVYVVWERNQKIKP